MTQVYIIYVLSTAVRFPDYILKWKPLKYLNKQMRSHNYHKYVYNINTIPSVTWVGKYITLMFINIHLHSTHTQPYILFFKKKVIIRNWTLEINKKEISAHLITAKYPSSITSD